MAKYFKYSILVALALVLGVCAYFLLAPKQSAEEIALVPTSESFEYTTYEAPYNDVFFADGSGIVSRPGNQTVSEAAKEWWQTSHFYMEKEIIIDAVCINFVDAKSFLPETYSIFLDKLEAVSNYFWEESKHTFKMKFNVYISQYDKSAYEVLKNETYVTFERKIFNDCKERVYETLAYHGPAQANMIVYSTKGVVVINNGKTNWPHVYHSGQFKPYAVLNYDTNIATYCHELYHVLGLPDLYSNTGLFGLTNYAGMSDIMSLSVLTSTSAWFKYHFGWYDIGKYSDNKCNDIEKISESGKYILSLPTAKGETSAYIFGNRESEAFFIEQRLYHDGSRFLVVQRVNGKLYSNIDAKNQAATMLLNFGNTKYWWDGNTGLLSEGDVVGNENNPLYYADETRVGYCISNIKLLDGDKISFDFYELEESDGAFEEPSVINPGHSNTGTSSVTQDRNIYVCAIMQSGEVANASEISLYDSTLKKYVRVENASAVYINGLRYYKITDVDAKHTKCKIVVWKYGFKETAEFKLTSANRYQVSTGRNILHAAGDFINDTAKSIGEFFHAIYRYFS